MARTNNCATCFFYDYHRTSNTLGAVTISTASPGVFTATGLASACITGTVVVFSTSGALPSPLAIQTPYYTLPINADTFNISSTASGTALNTTGSQSGIQTCDFVVMGCHRQAPNSSNADQTVSASKSTWQPVDPDYWCGEYSTYTVPQLVNTQTASYTLLMSDANNIVEMNSGSSNTLTIPLNASVPFPVGTTVDITQLGSGQTTINGTAGVTVHDRNGLVLVGQYSMATIYQRSTDEWVSGGDLT